MIMGFTYEYTSQDYEYIIRTMTIHSACKQTPYIASFPGLHAQLLSLAVWKAGEGLDGFITWCMPRLMSCSVWVCSLPFPLLSLNSVRSFCSVCPVSPIATGSIVASYSMWRQPRHASRDKSIQAFPPLFVLQATKAGRGGLGTRLTHTYWVFLLQAAPMNALMGCPRDT